MKTEDAPAPITEAQLRTLYTRGLIDKATWAGAIRSFRGAPGPLSQHSLRTCELAIEVLVEEAVNAACKAIQDRLGVRTGDLAAATLSDGTIERELTRYVHAELEAAQAADVVAAATPEDAP